MKNFLIGALTFFFSLPLLSAETVVDLEDVNPGSNSFYNGADLAGGFVSGEVEFGNTFDTSFFSWSGFAASSVTNSTTPGFENQYASANGAGASGSATYAVGFDSSFGQETDVLSFRQPVWLEGLWINNTAYSALSMQFGDAFAKPFGGTDGTDPDYFQLTISGRDANQQWLGSTSILLADFRAPEVGLDFIQTDWSYVPMDGLGPEVESLHFDLVSSDLGPFGMNTPAFFALDDLTYTPVASNGLLRIVAAEIGGMHVLLEVENTDSQPVHTRGWQVNGELVTDEVLQAGQRMRIRLDSGPLTLTLENPMETAVQTIAVDSLPPIQAGYALTAESLAREEAVRVCSDDAHLQLRLHAIPLPVQTRVAVTDMSHQLITIADAKAGIIDLPLTRLPETALVWVVAADGPIETHTTSLESWIGPGLSRSPTALTIFKQPCAAHSNAAFAAIAGVVWRDDAADGTLGELPLENVALTRIDVQLARLDNGSTGVPVHVQTDALGQFEFDLLTPGTYLVRVLSDQVPFDLHGLSTPENFTVTLNQGERAEGIHFGLVPRPTAVNLLNFDVLEIDGQRYAAWRTGSESSTLGFRVLGRMDENGEPIELIWHHAKGGAGGGTYVVPLPQTDCKFFELDAVEL